MLTLNTKIVILYLVAFRFLYFIIYRTAKRKAVRFLLSLHSFIVEVRGAVNTL